MSCVGRTRRERHFCRSFFPSETVTVPQWKEARKKKYMSHIAKHASRHAHHGGMLRSPRSAMLFVAFFARRATAVTPVNVQVVCAVATGLLRGHIREGKVSRNERKVSRNKEGAGGCRVWRARATSVLLAAISGRRRGRKRHGASPALCGQRPQIGQKALPNNRALQKSFSDFQARRRALTGRVQRPDQGRSGPHCSPVISPRFPPVLVVARRFSGVPAWIRVDFRLFAASVVQSRPDPGRMASATCTAIRVRCTSCEIQMFLNHRRTKSSVVGEPGHPPFDQFSDSLILSQKFPSTGPQL